MHPSETAPERPALRAPSRPAGPSGLGRALLAVAGGLAALLALLVAAAGGALLWLAGEQDERGYLSTGVHQVASPAAALATENLDVDLDGAGGLIDGGDLGTLRVQARSASAKPLFVGIARTADVEDYLRGVARATVTDIDLRPLDTELREEPGARRAAPPEGRPIWRASASGTGRQTMRWDVEDGDWSLVIMNADGSPGIRADVRAGARIPHVETIGWATLGGGLVLAAGAAVLVVLGMRTPRPPAPRHSPPHRIAEPAG